MKTFIVMFFAFFGSWLYGQDSIPVPAVITARSHSQVFSLSPMSKNLSAVNGLVFGVGHVRNKRVASQTINGLNLEVNPAPAAGALIAFMSLMYLPETLKKAKRKDTLGQSRDFFRIEDLGTTPHLKVNGLNLSTGCFFTQASMNGLNISSGNKFKDFNGCSLSVLGTIARRQTGLSIGLLNANNKFSGLAVGLYNQSAELNGLQLGLFNQAKDSKGAQLGIVNVSKGKGLQAGLWNVNRKRSLPFLNW